MPPIPALLIVAAEASADLHAAQVVRALRATAPPFRCFGVGGPALRAEGLEPLGSAEEMGVMGLWEVLRRLPAIGGAYCGMLRRVRRERPAAALLLDYPGFNFRLMKALDALGVPVVYYICPQVWAWHEERIGRLARHTAKRLVIFPFEEEFYRQRGVEARYVGHPLMDILPPVPPAPPADALRVGLFPGSRPSEVARLLPIFGRLALAASKRFPAVRFVLFPAPTLDQTDLLRHLPDGLEVEIVRNERYTRMGGLHLALMASGTITLEAALLGVPGLVGYRVNPLTYFMLRHKVQVPHIAIVNLLLGRTVFPEYLQEACGGAAMEAMFFDLLALPKRRAEIRQDALALRSHLRGGAAEAVASELRPYLSS